MTALLWAILILGGFLTGGIMWSVLIPRALAHEDICADSDDGNPGSFNVFHLCGKKIGALCLALDVAKGIVPVLIASLLLDAHSPLFALVVAAPVLGHVLGVFHRFHGGKSIATAFGVTIGLLPVCWIGFVTLAGLYIVFSTVAKIPSHRARSITVFVLFGAIAGVLCALFDTIPIGIGCLVIAVAVALKHVFMRPKPSVAAEGAEQPAETAADAEEQADESVSSQNHA